MQVSIFCIVVAELYWLIMAPGMGQAVKPQPQFFQPTAQRKIEQGKKVQHICSLRAEATINRVTALAMNEARSRSPPPKLGLLGNHSNLEHIRQTAQFIRQRSNLLGHQRCLMAGF